MNHLLSATALVATLAFTPALANANNFNGSTPHESCKRDEDNRQILGGFAGGVLGAVIGSQVAGNGARTEGSVIAGALGALAGAGIADKTIDCDPVYPEQTGYSNGSTYSSAPTYSGGTNYNGPAASYPATYSQGTSYPSTASYGGTQTYEDRVTVSNHPVYSDPTYGASTAPQTSYGSATSGTTYTGQSSGYALPTTTTYASAPQAPYSPAPVQTYAPQPRIVYASQPSPSYSAPSYSRSSHNPNFRRVRTTSAYASPRVGNHFHGRHSCGDRHY